MQPSQPPLVITMPAGAGAEGSTLPHRPGKRMDFEKGCAWGLEQTYPEEQC